MEEKQRLETKSSVQGQSAQHGALWVVYWSWLLNPSAKKLRQRRCLAVCASPAGCTPPLGQAVIINGVENGQGLVLGSAAL